MLAHRLFLLGVGVIALHVIDDTFAQPQAGTAASDHFVSGFVPLAFLAFAAWVFPRLSGGRRGALALALGVLGLAAGGEAFHYRGGGDDVTGFACLAAALLLLGVGGSTLWRTRRIDGHRFLRRALFGAVGLVVLAVGVVPIGMAYVEVHVARAAVPAPHLGAAHEDVTLTTSDGLELRGWYVPSRNGAAVIAFPGRKGPQPHARMLVRHGYGVLLLDRRGEGASEGDPTSWGWGGARDLQAAVAYLERRPDVRDGRIGGLGLSVGGELMIEAAASTPALKAVAAEGAGIRSLREVLSLPGAGKWAIVPFKAVHTAAVATFSNRQPPADLKSLVTKLAPRPLLLMYSGHGQGGEIDLNPVFHRAAGPAATLWQIRGAGHVGGIRAQPAEYERRVIAFFDANLPEP
jgi:dienelactone hydrolase